MPKDGPSAGIAMATALLSALTNRKIKAGIAMTGEVTLRGRVLPIGGLKEKTMAAKRYGIHTVLIPKDNARDLEEIDQTVRAALRFIPLETVDQVFAEVFCPSRVETKADAIPPFTAVRLLLYCFPPAKMQGSRRLLSPLWRGRTPRQTPDPPSPPV